MNPFFYILLPFIAVYSQFFFGNEIFEITIYTLFVISIIYLLANIANYRINKDILVLILILIILYSFNINFKYLIKGCLILSLIHIIVHYITKKKLIISEILIIFSTYFIGFSIFHWINFHSVYLDIKKNIFYLIIICLFGTVSCEFLTKKKIFNFLILINSIFLSILISMRIDSIFIGDGPVHWSYFTSPIHFFREGLFIINETPSQYGFLNILLPALLPLSDWTSFFIFQVVLINIIYILYVILLYKSTLDFPFKILISTTFLIALHFSTNDFISFSTIPSGSVIRFFPVYLLIYFLFILKNNISLLNKLIPIYLGFTFFWSIETFMISLCIYIFTFFKPNFLFILKIILYICITILITQFILYISYGKVLDLFLYILYPIIYSYNGVGSLPMGLLDPYWFIILLVLICLSIYKINSKSFGKAAIFGIIFTSIYYLNRSTPWNITVLIPLFYFIMVLNYLDNEFKIYLKVFITAFSVCIFLNNIILVKDISHKINKINIGSNIDHIVNNFNINKEISNLVSPFLFDNETYLVIDDDSYSFSGLGIIINNTLFNKFLLPTPLSIIKPLNKEYYYYYLNSHIKNLNHNTVYFIQKKNSINNFINIDFMKKYYYVTQNVVSENYNLWVLKNDEFK